MSGSARTRSQRRAREERTRSGRTESITSDPPSEGERDDPPPSTGAEQSYTPRNDSEVRAETLEEEHSRLLEELRIKKIREEIAAMRLEVAGDTQTIPTRNVILGHKRGVSETAEVPEARRVFIRPKDLPIFEGKTLKEVSTFITRWNIEFGAAPPLDDRMRIAHAATGLRGIALETWGRKQEDVSTWDMFTSWCRNLVKDPTNRTMHAYLKLKEAKQRKGQSVRDLLSYIEEQEKDIPEDETGEQRKAWSLLVCLSEEIRKAVMMDVKEITSREQVITAAQRQEELLRDVRDAPSESPAKSRHDTRPSRGRSGTFNRTQQTLKKGEKETSKKDSEQLCHRCKKPGHKFFQCPERDKDSRRGGAGETPARKNP